MGSKKLKRRSLRRIAAGLAAAASAIVPAMATARAAPLPEAIEAEARTTPPQRLLELASTHPGEVLVNRALRRLRTEDPEAHREIVLAARFARAEMALRAARAATDAGTLGLYACDCAERVAPLYERFAGRSHGLDQARAKSAALAATQAARMAAPVAKPATRPATALELALARFEEDVSALERQVRREATVGGGATGALARLVFAESEAEIARREDAARPVGASAASANGPAFRELTLAITAAEAIDQAVLFAVGGGVDRLESMCEAIAEAVYLDHLFRTGDPEAAIDAVFREIAWQSAHLRALAPTT